LRMHAVVTLQNHSACCALQCFGPHTQYSASTATRLSSWSTLLPACHASQWKSNSLHLTNQQPPALHACSKQQQQQQQSGAVTIGRASRQRQLGAHVVTGSTPCSACRTAPAQHTADAALACKALATTCCSHAALLCGRHNSAAAAHLLQTLPTALDSRVPELQRVSPYCLQHKSSAINKYAQLFFRVSQHVSHVHGLKHASALVLISTQLTTAVRQQAGALASKRPSAISYYTLKHTMRLLGAGLACERSLPGGLLLA
jgi:hypothetical protein